MNYPVRWVWLLKVNLDVGHLNSSAMNTVHVIIKIASTEGKIEQRRIELSSQALHE